MKIGIIGAGWYGCDLARSLVNDGHEIEIFEKKADILKGVSGNFGIRLHKGPHYPRSKATRESCSRSYQEFCNTYSDFIVPHDYSIYALGTKDALGNNSKVNEQQFKDVCHESQDCEEIALENHGYKNVITAMNLNEPSIILGDILRSKFKEKLENPNITIHYNFSVQNIEQKEKSFCITNQNGECYTVDQVINATGYQSFIPSTIKENFPVDIDIIYQVCIGLNYIDTKPNGRPFSFIVTDGWFPCIVPCIKEHPFQNTYLLTHGFYTNLASLSTPEEAHSLLEKLTDDFIESKIKFNTENEMQRFWPAFTNRFKYTGWQGTVLAKIVSKGEFRSAVTFKYNDIIYIIPGKVSNIFDVETEVKALLANKECINYQGVQYQSKGVLDKAQIEIAEKPGIDEPNTGKLNTYFDLTKSQSFSSTPQKFFKTIQNIPSTNKPKFKGIEIENGF